MPRHPLRDIPSLNALLQLADFRELQQRYGREPLVRCVREVLDEERRRFSPLDAPAAVGTASCVPDNETLAAECAARLALAARPSMRPVFNLTGTVLHTNLGRALYPELAVAAATQAMQRPVNLEYDLARAKRGERDDHVEAALMRLTGAEAAVVVNNNAAAVYLALNTFAAQREVPVSRGELIEIGGSFRIPEIMTASGCILREVGTTNRTHVTDFESAISERTGALMKVHASNYEIRGFTAQVPASELARIAHEARVPMIEDLGCGALVDLRSFGLPHEATPRESVAAGVDLVTFSGDKLMGGPQCGMIVGRKDLVDRIRRNPMKRVLRLDKVRLAALQAVLAIYADSARLAAVLPTMRLLMRSRAEIGQQAQRLVIPLQRAMGERADVRVVECASQIGSGALPADLLPSMALCLQPTAGGGAALQDLASALRRLPVPVIGRIHENAVWLDLRCLEEPQESEFIAQLSQLEP